MQKVCPLGVAFRTHRLLVFTLHDLRRLATGPIPDTPEEWEGRMHGRFSVLPDQAQPLQRSQLMAAFSAGTQIIQLRRICRRFDLSLGLDAALEAVARGNCVIAARRAR
ncbi:MAG: FUSC family protein [Mycolicibacterium sp.]|nr:FUSC family protein [Mycolicibacterium sp.]